MDFRDALKQLRGEIGITQLELANALHINFSTVGRWENGKTRPTRSMASLLIEFARDRGASPACIEALEQAIGRVGKERIRASERYLYTVEHASLGQLIDEVAFPLYVCDIETDEILYVNAKAEEMIGCGLEEMPNRTCYQCLMHRDTPCDFCHKSELREDRFIAHEALRLYDGTVYNVLGKRIKWNGRDAHARYIAQVESGGQLKSIIEKMNGGVTAILYDADGGIRHAFRSERYYEMFGYTAEQFVAESMLPFSVVVPQEQARVRATMDHIRTTGQPAVFRFEARKRDGGILSVSCSASLASIEGFGERVIISVLTDVTDAVAAERQALVFGQRLSAIMGNINNGVAASVLGSDGVVEYVFVTDRYYEMLGFTRDEYHREVADPFNLIFGEDAPRVRQTAASMREVGDSARLTYRAIRRDGKTIWLDVQITVMSFADVETPVHLSVFTDITHIVEANERIAAQRDQISGLLNDTPGGIAIAEFDVKNVAGTLKATYFNDKFFRYSGYTREEYGLLHQEENLHFVFREDAPAFLNAFEKLGAAALGEEFSVVIRCHTKGGGYRWMLMNGHLAEKRGDIRVVNLLQMDITPRKEAEDKLRISEEILRLAAETDKRAVVIYDVKANCCRVESHHLYSAKYGETLENIPQSLIDTGIVSAESAAVLSDLFSRIRDGEKKLSVSLSLRTDPHAYQWFECNAATVVDADGKPDHAVLVFHNITEQRVKEAVFQKWKNSIATRPPESYTLFRCNLSKDAWLDERDGRLLTIEFGEDRLPFNERTKIYVEQFVYPDDREAYTALMNADALMAMFYRGEHSATMEYREIGVGGEPIWRLLTVEMVEYLNSTDIQAFLMYEDIDEKKKAELKELELIETDPLTGVLNRAAFSQKVDALIEKESGAQHALLMMDMDGFKQLNDTFGHAAGDQALMDITAVLRAMVRESDLICRLGGDEFLIWLREIPYDAVIRKIARQIGEQVRKAFSQEVEITASIGVAVYPRDGQELDELYQCADKALYRVKQAGKDNFAFFSQDEPAPSDDDIGLAVKRKSLKTSRGSYRRRMLIADDDNATREMLSRIFQAEYLIETAKNGKEALLSLRHFGTAISIVLLDLMMPGVDGYEVLRRMQENVDLRTIPVVVVSVDNDRESLLKAIESGAADFVTKPVDPDLIRLRVQSAISKTDNERLRAQNSYLQLQRDEEVKYHTVLESTGTIVVEYDWRNHVFVYADDIERHIAGSYDHRPLWQVFLSDMVAGSDDVKTMQDSLLSLANDRERKTFTKLVMLKTPSGDKHWFRVNMYKQVDDFGLAEKMIITFNDVHEEVLASEKLLFQATRDELTGLYNRTGFIIKAAEMIADKEPGYYVMACLDIDKFKVINDQYGTKKGDDVLRRFAACLGGIKDAQESVCCRVMADNFAVLYPARLLGSHELEATHQALERLDGSIPPLRFSAGRCVVHDKQLPVSAIYDRATIAKDTVKGRFDTYIATYDESMRTAILRQQEITGQMKSALENGQFEVWLQPQFNHATGMLTGAEALVRWRHPKEGIISPAEFIPIFEQNGFVYEVDKFVWEQTCALLRKWLNRGLTPVPISVNISRYDVFRKDLIDVITGLIAKYGLPADLLRLEITESAFSESAEQIIHVVEKLVALGFVVEIDDFGSGYSSLNTLKDVPAQVLKMDMRFLENDSNAQRGGSIIESVVRMARWLGMSVIAEGVETVEQADYLRSIGCEHVQGYLYAKPKKMSEYEQFFSDERIEVSLSQPIVTEAWNNNAFWNPKSMETLIFNSYIGGACIFEYDGTAAELLRYNDAYAEIFRSGFLFSDAHQDILAFLQGENREALRGCIESAVKTKKETVCELHLETDDRKALYVRATLRQIAQAGDRRLFYCVVTDITAQREAERGEREAASRVAAILDHVDGGITAVCTRNDKPEMIFSNDRFFTQLGYTRAQFAEELDVYFDAIHPEDRMTVWNKVHDTLRSKTPCSIEYRCVKRDGSVIHIRSNIAACHIDGIDGDVIITVETDISELVAAQEKIAGTSERLAAIMDNATSGITAVILHQDGTVEYLLVNDHYFELLGYTREQYVAEGVEGLQLMHPDDLKKYQREIIDLNEPGQVKTFEFRAKRRDGRWVWLRDDIAVVTLNGVDAPVQLACFSDITARKRFEERLRFINEVAGELLAVNDPEQAIDITLRRSLRYFQADRSYIVELDALRGVSYNTYEVCAKGVKSEKENLQGVPYSETDFWYETLMRRHFFLVENVEELADESLRSLLRAQNIRSIVLAPLWRDGHLTGFMGVDNADFIPDDIKTFTAPADYVALTLSKRDIVRKSERDRKTLETLMNDVPDGADGGAWAEEYRLRLLKDGFVRSVELLDSLPCGAALYEFDGRTISVIHINKRYWELVCREPADNTAASPFDVFYPGDRQAVLDELTSAVRQKRNARVEARILCGASEYKPFRISAIITPETDGRYLLSVSYEPISDRAMSLQDMLPIMLSTMMATSDDLSFIKDADGRYVTCSKTAVAAFGQRSERDIIGKTGAEVFGKDVVGQFAGEDEQIYQTGKPVLDRLVKLPLRDGSVGVFCTSKFPLLNGEGKVVGIYAVCRDVTSEKKMEFELKTLLQVIPSGLVKYSADDREQFAYINHNFVAALGYTEEQFRAKYHNCFREMIWHEDREAVEREIAVQEADGQIGRVDFRVEAADGQLHWFHNEGVMVTDQSGDAWYYVTLVDITAQRRSEESLRLAEEEYRLATRHSGHTIGRYDVKAQTLTITDDVATRLALPECIPDVPYGRVKLGKISKDTADAYIAFYEDIKKGKKEGAVTFRKLLSIGWRWITEHATTIFDEQGKPVSAIISYKDVTEQQEKELVYKKWQQSIEERDPKTYTLFRCNLNNTSAFDIWEGSLIHVQLGDEFKSFDERTAAFMDQCVYEGDRARYAAFVNSDTMLAEYHRGHRANSLEYRQQMPDGSIRWLKLSVDLVESPNSKDVEAYMLYESIDEQKKAELETVHLAETDPLTGLLNRKAFSDRVNALIGGSKPGVQHAFFMLDIDGFKLLNDTFGHAAGDDALVETAQKLQSLLRKDDLLGRLGGDEFVLFLTYISGDKNIGRKAEQICAHLAKTYSAQVRLTASVGVSLFPRDGADAHTLYERADTALYAAKESGRNTYQIYSHELPAKSAGADQHEMDAEAAGKTTARIKKRRMLIVDDDEADRTLIRKSFEKEYLVEAASDGATALSRMRYFGTALSVILLDLNMHGMNGFDVLDKARSSPETHGVPIIVVSGEDDSETCMRAIRGGATDYVTKPVQPELIRLRVAAAVSRAENERLRAQNSYLQTRGEEVSRYQTALSGMGLFVVEMDCATEACVYDSTISGRLKGAYDGRAFWQILLSDNVADEQDVNGLRDFLRALIADPARTVDTTDIRMRASDDVKHRFTLHVNKILSARGAPQKLMMTFWDRGIT